MADNLQKRPSKGILKNSSSFDKKDTRARPGPASRKSKETKWDEMNIIATLHPPDKDYGHMKIDEPKTPYNYEDPDKAGVLDAAQLAEKIRLGTSKPPKAMQPVSDDDGEDDDADLTPEARAKKKDFESKRKKHYNEFHAVKLARKLLEDDEEEDDKKDSAAGSSKSGKVSPKPVDNSHESVNSSKDME